MDIAKPKGKPSRPDLGITETYRQVYVTLSPEMISKLDRLADRREQGTGKKTSRLDLIREAITQYLERA